LVAIRLAKASKATCETIYSILLKGFLVIKEVNTY